MVAVLRHGVGLTGTLIGLALAAPCASFSKVTVGSTITNVQMLTMGGETQPLLGNEEVSVFLFFRPDQEHSISVLKEVAGLERELAGKSVHWVCIVSDRYSREEVRGVMEEAELKVPVLVDSGDALAGKLGVHLHPVVGVTDRDHVLKAYLHFTKINFVNTLHAHILHVLGEMSDAEADRTLHPLRTEPSGVSSAAKSNLRFARMLFGAGKLPEALERARKSLEYDPAQAEAHALVGVILERQGNCPGALQAFEEALRLDPNEPTAREGKKACAGGS